MNDLQDGATRAVWNRQYKEPNRKGVRHQNFCLHDEPGVTICTCNPLRNDPKGGSESTRKRSKAPERPAKALFRWCQVPAGGNHRNDR